MESMADDDATSSADVVDRIFSFDDSLSRSSRRLFTDDDVAAMIAGGNGSKGTLFPASSSSETPREEWKRSEGVSEKERQRRVLFPAGEENSNNRSLWQRVSESERRKGLLGYIALGNVIPPVVSWKACEWKRTTELWPSWVGGNGES